jgi:hypothetical protein
MTVSDCRLVALVYAVAAKYTSAIVYPMVFEVDTRCFAVLGTESATDTFVFIDMYLEP